MAYNPFLENKPVVADDVDDVVNYTRENLMALRDMIVHGEAIGWDFAVIVGGGTNFNPDALEWSSGVYRMRQDITWGTSGGADGNPTQIDYTYSSDSGSNYDKMLPEDRQTFAYNGDGTVASISWSVSP